jgi:hypothetical protein
MEERMKDVKDDFIKSLLEHDVDEPLPPEHERKIREGLGALLHAPLSPNAESPKDNGGALTDAAVRGGKLATYAAIGTALVVGAGLGFAIGRGTAPSTTPIVMPSSTTSSLPAPPIAAPTNVATDASSSPSTPTAPPPTSLVRPTATATSSGDTFDRERSLLDRARAALVRHDANAAAQALDESERDFPKSQHTEEREYLRIQIARERGETDRVRTLAKAFLAKYPQSLYRARVEPLAQ